MANRYGTGIDPRAKQELIAAYMSQQQPQRHPLAGATQNIVNALMFRKMMQEQQASQQQNQQAQQDIARALMGGGNPQNQEAAMFNQQNPGELGMVQTSPQKLPDQQSALQQALMNPQALQSNPMLAQVMAQQMAPQEAYTLAPGAVRMQGGRKIAANPPAQKDPIITAQVRAAGFDPESAEGQAFARQILLKPGVEVNMSDKLGPVSPGMRRVPDPTSPTGTKLLPEPGGPQDQEYNKAVKDIKDTEAAFNLLSDAIGEIGKVQGVVSGEGRGRLGTAYGNARSSIRTLYQTGVLQPGELPMLEEALANPNSLSSFLDPRSRTTLKAQIAELKKLLGTKKRNLDFQYGKQPGTQPNRVKFEDLPE